MPEIKHDYRKFIDMLEMIYALFLAVGLSYLFLMFDIKLFYLSLLSVSCLVLIRFFFAPSKNIEYVLEEINKSTSSEKDKDKSYRIIMLIDVPVLFMHAILFALMCVYASKEATYIKFYWSFMCLLILNACWLMSIHYRVYCMKDKCRFHVDLWAINNIVNAVLMFIVLILVRYLPMVKIGGITIQINIIGWVLLFVIAMANCLVDLFYTYKTYLFHEKQ